MSRMREKTREVTIRAGVWQISAWESAARGIGWQGDIQRFLVLAGDLCARYLREASYQRTIPDPVRRRLSEKAVLGALLKAAKAAAPHLPAYVDRPIGGRLFVGRDLKQAIQSVQGFLAETGEEYSCP